MPAVGRPVPRPRPATARPMIVQRPLATEQAQQDDDDVMDYGYDDDDNTADVVQQEDEPGRGGGSEPQGAPAVKGEEQQAAAAATGPSTAADAAPGGAAADVANPKPNGGRLFADLPDAGHGLQLHAASGWQDIYDEDDCDDAIPAPKVEPPSPAVMDAASSGLPLDDNGHLPFYLIDAYESADQPGAVCDAHAGVICSWSSLH